MHYILQVRVTFLETYENLKIGGEEVIDDNRRTFSFKKLTLIAPTTNLDITNWTLEHWSTN